MRFRPMKSARFLVVALLALWGVGGCSSYLSLQRTKHAFHLRGSVLDSLTRQPVPGIRVWGQAEQAHKQPYASSSQTDSNGHFELRMPVCHRGITGSISTYTLLYCGRAAIPTDTTQPATLMLKRNAFRFKPYGCQQPADSALIARYATSRIEGLPGSQYAFLIRDTTIHQPRKLRTITFNTGENAFPREPFVVRIYPCSNQPAAPPVWKLLSEVVSVFPAAGTFSYNVSDYNIIVPAGGFYISVEYLAGCDSCPPSLTPLDDYTPTGPILRPPCARSDIRTWEYAAGKDWHRATAAENCWPLYESAISVEVEPTPTPPTKR